MDFDLSEEQRLLQESLGRLIADRYTFERRKVSIYGGTNEIQKNIIAKAILGL